MWAPGLTAPLRANKSLSAVLHLDGMDPTSTCADFFGGDNSWAAFHATLSAQQWIRYELGGPLDFAPYISLSGAPPEFVTGTVSTTVNGTYWGANGPISTESVGSSGTTGFIIYKFQ